MFRPKYVELCRSSNAVVTVPTERSQSQDHNLRSDLDAFASRFRIYLRSHRLRQRRYVPLILRSQSLSSSLGSVDEYFADLVKAFREEIADLYELGCRRIQFDDPGFAFYCSGVTIAGMAAQGVDREKLLSMHIDVYNAITANRPADLVISVHTCRGNMKVSSSQI